MGTAAGEKFDAAVFEVSTESTDALRARIAVVGELTADTISLLASAVTTHLRAGRRYLRVDVSRAAAADPTVLETLTDLRDRAARLGGMLVFDASPASDALTRHVAALRSRG